MKQGKESFHDVGLVDEGIVTSEIEYISESESAASSDGTPSIPFDEASMLPVTSGQSVFYSIANSSEYPGDRHSLVDVEEAVALQRKQSAKPIRTAPHKSKSSRRSNSGPSSRPARRQATRKQQRCTRILVVFFLLATITVAVGGIAVYYFLYMDHDDDGSGTEIPGQTANNSPEDSPSDSQVYQFGPTWPPIPEYNAPVVSPVEAPVQPLTLEPTRSPTRAPVAPTRSPTVAQEVALLQYLSENHGVYFADDPEAPANQAISWLVEEANTSNFTLQFDDSIVQRFALVAISLSVHEIQVYDVQGNETVTVLPSYTTFGEMYRDACDDWDGIVCVNETVTELLLGNRRLTGTIPLEVGLLTSLVSLDLSQNQLYGRIPESLYQLTDLEELYLYHNMLSGTVSDRIGDLESLSHIQLSHNQLSGSIPLTMSSNSSNTTIRKPYHYLNLYSNKFSGPLPTGLDWRDMWYLDLGRNSFTGTIPEDIQNWWSLRHLHLDHNRFNGTLPEVLPQAGNNRLVALHLDHNEFTGAFPADWELRNVMVSMTLHNNSFTERIDTNVCTLNIFDGGEMVEFTADCDVCNCRDTFCQQC